MTDMVKIISLLDGSVYVMRPLASQAEIEAALSAARAAQAEWTGITPHLVDPFHLGNR